jgi:hypothetical protein
MIKLHQVVIGLSAGHLVCFFPLKICNSWLNGQSQIGQTAPGGIQLFDWPPSVLCFLSKVPITWHEFKHYLVVVGLWAGHLVFLFIGNMPNFPI